MEAEFESERRRIGRGYALVLGVDEAGRGPLAGPVVAAAAVMKKIDDLRSTIDELDTPTPHPRGLGSSPRAGEQEKEWALVRDSKTLSEKQRETAFAFVHEKFSVGVGIVHPETIDRMNILEATFLAMKAALSELKTHDAGHGLRNALVLVDGNTTIPNLSIDQEAVVGGDGLVRSIAAASIVAKVTRDRMMVEYDRTYPLYGFAGHKGYGTAAHLVALRKHGPCPIHRMSFRPVREATVEGINGVLRRASRKA